jgi:alpha-glucoside transport system substrate-binding protein
MEASRSQYPSQLVDLVTVDDQPAAVWLTTDVKGLIWYRPPELAERGLALPTTLDQLADLSEQIRATDDGVSPWCLTMEAGASTGWVGTDWVEDYAIRRLGSDSYDQWTEGELPFDSPMLTTVFEELDDLLRAPGAIAGGSRAVLNTPWEDSASLLLNQSATCLMAHQADFLRREMPDGTQIGPDGDIDFFLLPSADGASAPLLLGGTLAAPLSDDESVSAAMQLVASQALAEQLNQTPGFLSPHLGVDRATVPDATTRRLLDLLATTSDVRFDGSDLMPPAVGIGTFWTGMRAFFAGEDLDTLVAEIQAGWPASEPG